MNGLGSCPVCFLDLRPGIPLNVHLDTHPKEMIVKALVRALDSGPDENAHCNAYADAGPSATIMTADLDQRSVQSMDYRPQPSDCMRSEYFYQQSLPEAPDIEAGYMEDGQGNLVYCAETIAQDECDAVGELQVAMDSGGAYDKTEYTASETAPPEHYQAQAGRGDTVKPKHPPSAKASATILSVSVLGPKDNITWKEPTDQHRLSPNAILPTHPKKSAMNIDPVTVPQPQTPQTAPSPPTTATTTTIRPVATSVIRTTAESKGAQAADTPEVVVDDPVPPTDEDIAVDSVSKTDTESGRVSPQPSTSGVQSTPLRWSRGTPHRATKVLKVTFKKPVHLDPCEEEPQPSTSKQTVEVKEECPEPISEAVEQYAVAVETSKAVTVDEAAAADAVTAGMLQLKAEACEEVFISQHSLIKLENGDDGEDEDEVPFSHPESLNDSKGSSDGELAMMAGSSMKVFLDLKREEEPSLIEELCLSESSLGSLIAGVGERMNVNIRAEEAMPAKGEISEQESNADSELLWPSNAIETFETSRILPSYETSVARESWNFGQANSCDNLTFNGIPKLSAMIGMDEGTAIKVETFQYDEAVAGPSNAVDGLQSQSAGSSFAEPSNSLMAAGSSSASKASSDRKLRPYSCPGCPESFRLFRQRKDHIIEHHEELLSKKQRYTYMRQFVKLHGSESGNAANGQTGHHLGPESFTRRIEQLSVIKLHRFLIELNLKALKETSFGQRDEFKGLLMEFSQRRMYFCTDCKQQFTTMREYRKHMVHHPVKCYTCEKRMDEKGAVLLGEDCSVELKVEEEDEGGGGGEGTSSGDAAGSSSSSSSLPSEAAGELEAVPAESDALFWNWRRFVEHQKMHLGLNEVKTCKLCNVSFSSRRKLNLHTSSVHRRKAHQCSFCPRTFMHSFRLKEHKQKHHFNFQRVTVTRNKDPSGGSKQKDYLCPCGEVFHSAAKFAWHKETHEKNPKGCLYCRERFVHKNSLSRHIRLAHPDKYTHFKDTLPCPVCNNRFIRTSLKTHMASHMKRAEFQCSICNKVLSTKWNLKIHRWTHNSRSQMPFKCPTCPKAFMRANDLQTHQNTHKAIRPFTCDHCGCQFSRKYNWVRHTREHETDKKYCCDLCGKAFHRAYYLKEHLRSHTNERPFECTICGKTSTTKTNHNKHLKIHHARDVTATEG